MLFRATAIISLISLSAALFDHAADNRPSQQDEPGHQSLPSLLHASDIKDLSLNWETYGDIKLDTGRLLFSKDSAAIWSTPQLSNSKAEWTIETLFRYGSSGSTVDANNGNGLSFWLIDPSNSLPINDNNKNNFGGPSEYDGFQFLINNEGGPGLKIFANDGTKPIVTSTSQSIGDCYFNYLESDIPFTMRVSYSKENRWFKVQIDNNLCFKTESIKIPDHMSDFKFGVSGSIHPQSQDFFELFGIKVWTHLTTDAIDDHGLIAGGSVKNVQVEDKEKDHIPPSYIRKSLMERQKQAQEGVRDTNIDRLYDKLAKVESSINGIQLGSGADYDSKILEVHLKDIQKIQEQQLDALRDLQQGYIDFKSTIANQYSQMLSAFSQLNEKVIGEVREHQYSMDELDKKVDLLMANHKEIAHQYQTQQSIEPKQDVDYSNVLVKWVLIPLFAIILVLTVFVYRLRHDIKHSKLL